MKTCASVRSTLLIAAAAMTAACAAEHTAAPAPFDPSAPAPSAAPPALASASRAPAPAPAQGADEPRAQTGAQKRPLEITSQCATAANYFVGDDPKAGGTGKRTVEPMAVLPVERRPDGSQTVWLLDEHFSPLIKVSITRGMKKIEVGRSCRTLDAH